MYTYTHMHSLVCVWDEYEAQERDETWGINLEIAFKVKRGWGHPQSEWSYSGSGLVAKSCLTLCDPWTVAHQAPVRGISQASILEWVAISFSREWICKEEQNLAQSPGAY